MLSNQSITKYVAIIFILLLFSTSKVFAVLSQTYQSQQTAYQECVIDRDSTNGNSQNSGNDLATCTQLAGLAPSYSHTYRHSTQSPPRLTYKHYFYNEACSGGTTLNTTTGNCEASLYPDCTTIGFDESANYIGGYCQVIGSTVVSNPSHCITSEQTTVEVPSCTLTACPDGSLIDPAFQTCPTTQECWNGLIVGSGESCPTPPFVCPDGSNAATQADCPTPDQLNHTCWNGSTIPLTTSCPIQPNITCFDGSTATDSLNCPAPTQNPITCQNGSQVQDQNACPAINNTTNNVNDSSTSTSTSTSTATTTNNTDSTVNTTTTSTTTTTTVDMNLDSVNSRLDNVNNNLSKITDDKAFNGQQPQDLYTPDSSLTYDSALTSFTDRLETSPILTAGSNALSVSIPTSSCPIWTTSAITGGFFTFPAITIDQQCSSMLTNIWPIIQAVLLAVASFYAVRIAFL